MRGAQRPEGAPRPADDVVEPGVQPGVGAEVGGDAGRGAPQRAAEADAERVRVGRRRRRDDRAREPAGCAASVAMPHVPVASRQTLHSATTTVPAAGATIRQ